MKEIFDRHAQSLSTAERQAIWRTNLVPREMSSRSRLGWAFAATVMATGMITFTVIHREPAELSRFGPAGPDSNTPGVTRSSPGEHDAIPEGERDRIVRPGSSHQEKPFSNSIVDPGPARARPSRPALEARRRVAGLATPESVAQVAVVPHNSAPSPPSTAISAGMGVVSGVITDSQNNPVPYANVIVAGTGRGAMADENGAYRIDGLSPGTHSLRVLAVGYEKQTREGIQVAEGGAATADIRLTGRIASQMEEINVEARREVDTNSFTTKQSISAPRLKELPVDNLREAISSKAGVVARGGDLHFRGGSGGETRSPIGGVPRVLPPVIPITGGTTLPNDEAHDSMFFRSYGVNPFITTDEDSLSTFAVDVDAASYTVTRRYIALGHLPPTDAVRVEEFVNFFPQGYPRFENDDFRILVDGAPSPFGKGLHLLRVGIKGREIGARDRKPARLTFVIDVSGSMERENRLQLVKQSLRLLVDELRDDDRVGIVVYGTAGRVLLEPIALGKSAARAGVARRHSNDSEEDESRDQRAGRRRILEAIDHLRAEGSTNAEEGLALGYEMARRGYHTGAINRIVLCSDGVANVGLTGSESILERTRTEADRGIHLSTIGFGMGNYNDVLMEQLANKGDGNYYYVDDLDEARRVLVENLTGTLQTIATDAKIQVEFHSSRVLRYRLLGFENRDVADRDFRNDKVDAGEIGAGHEVTALYEVKLAPHAERGTIATVKLRYSRPEGDRSGAREVREIATDFSSSELVPRFEHASPRLRLDAAAAEFAEILRGSYWAKEGRLSEVLSVARSAARGMREDAASGFVALVEEAARLSRSLEREKPKEER